MRRSSFLVGVILANNGRVSLYVSPNAVPGGRGRIDEILSRHIAPEQRSGILTLAAILNITRNGRATITSGDHTIGATTRG